MLSNDIKSYLDTYYEEMLKLLERLVNIDSGSACKEGIDRVASIMAREYEKGLRWKSWNTETAETP